MFDERLLRLSLANRNISWYSFVVAHGRYAVNWGNLHDRRGMYGTHINGIYCRQRRGLLFRSDCCPAARRRLSCCGDCRRRGAGNPHDRREKAGYPGARLNAGKKRRNQCPESHCEYGAQANHNRDFRFFDGVRFHSGSKPGRSLSDAEALRHGRAG